MIRYFLPLFLVLSLSGCYLVPYQMTAQKAATLDDSRLISACGPRDENQLKKRREMREPAVAEAVRRGLIRKSMADNILDGFVVVGMSENEARSAWGTPRNINSTHSASFSQDQWCYGKYGGSYLYFSGGRLRTIQN